jgi:uncharacterized protein
MPVDHIRYDLLTQDALRGVIRTVLTDVAVKGLPGDHHFFITFDTRADGVRMSPRLATNYPGEMTIVLQHQFWDLTVGEDDFEVGLAFNGIPERLHIPLKAVRAFMDPSVQFGLQFAVDVEAASEAHADEPAHPPVKPKPVPPQRPSPARQPAAKPPKQSKKESQPQAAVTNATQPVPLPTAGKEASTGETGEVVRLDRFRKK